MLHSKHLMVPGGITELMEIKTGMKPYLPAIQDHPFVLQLPTVNILVCKYLYVCTHVYRRILFLAKTRVIFAYCFVG